MDFLWLLEGIRTPSMDKIMQVITYFGQELILVGIICFLYWCVNKSWHISWALLISVPG